MSSPIIGCVQLNSQQDITANFAIVTKAIAKASECGASLVVLPENMLSMGGQHKLSEQFDDLSAKLAKLARRYHIYILAGTLPCPYRPDGTPVMAGLLRQVSQMFDPSGQRIARYDKIHLFRALVSDNKGSYDEGRTFEAGDRLVVADCDFANLSVDTLLVNDLQQHTAPYKVGMMVCFDLRFAPLAQRLRAFGADILTAPSAFTYPTGQAHWQLLLQARALDAQCMVVGAAQGGLHYYKSHDNDAKDDKNEKNKEPQSRRTWGHAAITNANGSIVAKYDHDVLKPPSLTTHVDDKARCHKQTVDKNTSSDNTKQGGHIAADYVLLTAPFDRIQQQQWRQNLPINRCQRLG